MNNNHTLSPVTLCMSVSTESQTHLNLYTWLFFWLGLVWLCSVWFDLVWFGSQHPHQPKRCWNVATMTHDTNMKSTPHLNELIQKILWQFMYQSSMVHSLCIATKWMYFISNQHRTIATSAVTERHEFAVCICQMNIASHKCICCTCKEAMRRERWKWTYKYNSVLSDEISFGKYYEIIQITRNKMEKIPSTFMAN